MLRRFLVAVGGVVWIVGLCLLVTGDYRLGGAMIVGGGLCLVVAAAGGWTRLGEGLTNWLYFWR